MGLKAQKKEKNMLEISILGYAFFPPRLLYVLFFLLSYSPNHLCHIDAIIGLQNTYLHIHIF